MVENWWSRIRNVEAWLYECCAFAYVIWFRLCKGIMSCVVYYGVYFKKTYMIWLSKRISNEISMNEKSGILCWNFTPFVFFDPWFRESSWSRDTKDAGRMEAGHSCLRSLRFWFSKNKCLQVSRTKLLIRVVVCNSPIFKNVYLKADYNY